MMRKQTRVAALFVFVLAFAGMFLVSDAFGETMSSREIWCARRSWNIPDEERDMSNREVVDHLLGRKGWASYALLLRCRLGDDETRREIYRMLSQVAIEYQDVPLVESTAATTAVFILSQQKEHRDDAVPAVLDVLAKAHDLVLIDGCYSALGSLGGPEAIRVLKEAILAGPPDIEKVGLGGREQYYYLYNYLAGCGADAVPALFEIEKAKDKVSPLDLYTALGMTRNESAVPYLLDRVHEAEKTSRETPGAAERVKVISKALCYGARQYSPETRTQILEVLLRHVDDPAWEVRETIAGGLGMAGDARHIPILEKMALEDPFWYESTSLKKDADRNVKKIVYPVRETATKALDRLRRYIAQKEKSAD